MSVSTLGLEQGSGPGRRGSRAQPRAARGHPYLTHICLPVGAGIYVCDGAPNAFARARPVLASAWRTLRLLQTSRARGQRPALNASPGADNPERPDGFLKLRRAKIGAPRRWSACGRPRRPAATRSSPEAPSPSIPVATLASCVACKVLKAAALAPQRAWQAEGFPAMRPCSKLRPPGAKFGSPGGERTPIEGPRKLFAHKILCIAYKAARP
jgi:hypothetical protein